MIKIFLDSKAFNTIVWIGCLGSFLLVHCGGAQTFEWMGSNPISLDQGDVHFSVDVKGTDLVYLCGSFYTFEPIENQCYQMQKTDSDRFELLLTLGSGVYFYYYKAIPKSAPSTSNIPRESDGSRVPSANDLQGYTMRDATNPLLSGYKNHLISVLWLTDDLTIKRSSNLEVFNKTKTVQKDALRLTYSSIRIHQTDVETILALLSDHLDQLIQRFESPLTHKIDFQLVPIEAMNFSPIWGYTTLTTNNFEKESKIFTNIQWKNTSYEPRVVVPYLSKNDLDEKNTSIYRELLKNEVTKAYLAAFLLDRCDETKQTVSWMMQQSFFYWAFEGIAAAVSSDQHEFLGIPLVYYARHRLALDPDFSIRSIFALDLAAYQQVTNFSVDYVGPLGSFYDFLHQRDQNLDPASKHQEVLLLDWLSEEVKNSCLMCSARQDSSVKKVFHSSLDALNQEWVEWVKSYEKTDTVEAGQSMDLLAQKYPGSTYLFGIKIAFLFNRAFFIGLEKGEPSDITLPIGAEILAVDDISVVDYFQWFSIWREKNLEDSITIKYINKGDVTSTEYFPGKLSTKSLKRKH